MRNYNFTVSKEEEMKILSILLEIRDFTADCPYRPPMYIHPSFYPILKDIYLNISHPPLNKYLFLSFISGIIFSGIISLFLNL